MGHVLVVEQLIVAGAGLDVKTNNGYEPISRLQRLCDIRAGSRLVGRGTALIVAADQGKTLVVEQLIAAGAGLDLKTNDGYEPIYPTATAVRYPSRLPTSWAGALRSFWPRGRVTRSWSSSSSPPAPASMSRTTVGTSQYTRLQRLCDESEPAADFLGRDTALIYATAEGHTDITAALIFAGADVDVSNNYGYGQHRRGRMVAIARALERTSPGQGDCEAVSEVTGKSAEYVEAVRKVRRVEHSLVGLRAAPAGAAPGWRRLRDSGCWTHEWPWQPLWALLCTVRHWDLLAGTGRRGLAWLKASSKLQRQLAHAAVHRMG
jgi:hypothetical protein